MLSVEALDVILAISEGELIEGIIVALLAAPQLAVFFEKFPRMKNAVTKDIPRWRELLKARLHDTQRAARTSPGSYVLSGKPTAYHKSTIRKASGNLDVCWKVLILRSSGKPRSWWQKHLG